MPTAEEMNRTFDARQFWADFKDANAEGSTHGLLIDYEFCTNCHSCEVACQMYLGLDADNWGIKVAEYGPVKNVKGDWEWTYVPVPTDLCDGCEERVAAGRLPNCVHHCQSGVMYYGTIEELAKKASEKKKMVLFTL